MERELARAHAFLALEEQRNAALPVQAPIASADEFDRRFNEAVTRVHGVSQGPRHPDGPRLHGSGAAGAHRHVQPGPARVLRRSRLPRSARSCARTTITGSTWRGWRRSRTASPIRRGPLLYNIFITRTEGHATGWEEMMLQAGMFDARPRSRELIYVLLAQRAARALGDLRMHANAVDARAGGARSRRRTRRAAGCGSTRTRSAASSISTCSSRPTAPATSSARFRSKGLLAARKRQLGDALHDQAVHGRVQRRRPDPGVAGPLGDDGEKTVGQP